MDNHDFNLLHESNLLHYFIYFPSCLTVILDINYCIIDAASSMADFEPEYQHYSLMAEANISLLTLEIMWLQPDVVCSLASSWWQIASTGSAA